MKSYIVIIRYLIGFTSCAIEETAKGATEAEAMSAKWLTADIPEEAHHITIEALPI